MTLLCRRRQKRVLSVIEEGRTIGEADQKHLDQCRACGAWFARQEQLGRLLKQVGRPEPGPYLPAEVMAFIYREEESRHRQEEARRRAARVRRVWTVSLIPVLRREAWPIAFATLAVVWGAWISPALTERKEGSQANVVSWVESIPESLDQRCEALQRRLAEGLAAVLQPVGARGPAGQDQTSRLPGDRSAVV